MTEPPPTNSFLLHAREDERIRTLRESGMLDSACEERFDRIVRIARRLFGTDFAFISLVDRERQWFKAAAGLDVVETPRDISFCTHVVADDQALIVPDAHLDTRFIENPLVTGDPKIRFYAGEPIRAKNGLPLGTICVVDSQPRMPTSEEMESLRDIAALVEAEIQRTTSEAAVALLEQRVEAADRKAATDDLTRSWSRGFILEVLARELARHERAKEPLGILMIDVDHFAEINNTHGHPVGDEVLKLVATRIRMALRDYDMVGRYGGDEFIAVLPQCDVNSAATVANRIRSVLAKAPAAKIATPTVSIGIATTADQLDIDGATLVRHADEALYDAKRGGRNRVSSIRANLT